MRILHLATAADWADAVADGHYRRSTLDQTFDDVGFIHASRPDQVDGVASRFYADVTEPLVLLVMDTDRLEQAGVPVLEEDIGTGETFPHLYAVLPVGAVDEVRGVRVVDGHVVDA